MFISQQPLDPLATMEHLVPFHCLKRKEATRPTAVAHFAGLPRIATDGLAARGSSRRRYGCHP